MALRSPRQRGLSVSTLSAGEWRAVRETFETALKLAPEKRERFIADGLADDRLREHARRLLDAHARADSFLETSPAAVFDGLRLARDLTGTALGPYELEARIGSGGMGDVYRARDSRLGRVVAIKVLSESTTAGETRNRFEREARAVAGLNHRHICTLHDIGTSDTVSYLVMEFLDGETLADIVARGPLPLVQSLDYAVQIASALCVAHAAGIIHRDLKPGNIMITASGVKLLDFGLAKAPIPSTLPPSTAVSAPARDRTTTGHFGTLCYMAPEQLHRGPIDVRTDIYAFGCVLVEMLTGAKAFPDRVNAVGPEECSIAPPPIDTHGRLPDALQRILGRCLAVSPEDRWNSADELRQALQAAAAAVADGATRSRASLRFARHPVTVAVVVALLIGAGLWKIRTGSTVTDGAVPARSLAVLPLQTVGELAPGDEHLGLSIADSIITRLATVRRLGIRPTTAVMSYADGRADPARASADLKVDYLVTGTIQRGPSTYRVTFQLVRDPAGTVTWARTYDVVRSGLRDVQDGVAEQLVDALEVQLGADERNRLHRRYTDNADAYDQYQKGRAALLNYTEAGMKQAIAAFEQAVAIDPDYALARAGLAIARAWFSIRYAYETDALDWGARADADARGALQADPSLADARLAIAGAAGTLYGKFNWPLVIDQASRALEMDPTLELAHVVLMRAYFHLGLFDRMDAEAEAAHRLNPLGNVEVARLEVASSLFAGRYDSARNQAAALLARSDAPVIRNYLGLAQFYTGDAGGARATLAGVKRGGQPDVRSQAALASIEAASGEREAARARALAIEHGPYMDHHVAYSLAATWAQLGDTLLAIKWLRQAAATGFPCFPSVQRDPLLNPIRQSGEFMEFVSGLRQDFERDRARYSGPR